MPYYLGYPHYIKHLLDLLAEPRTNIGLNNLLSKLGSHLREPLDKQFGEAIAQKVEELGRNLIPGDEFTNIEIEIFMPQVLPIIKKWPYLQDFLLDFEKQNPVCLCRDDPDERAVLAWHYAVMWLEDFREVVAMVAGNRAIANDVFVKNCVLEDTDNSHGIMRLGENPIKIYQRSGGVLTYPTAIEAVLEGWSLD